MNINHLTVGAIQTNCWIITHPELPQPDDCIVVDPGGDGERILYRLEKLGLRPANIVLTHAHFDHIAALPRIAAVYPDAEIAIHQAEAAKLGPDSLELHKHDLQSAGAPFYIAELSETLPEAAVLLNEGDIIGPFTVFHTPGHSSGSICLYSNKEKILISGDTIFYGDTGRTDLPGGNRELMTQSLHRLLTLDEDTIVYPGHGPITNIGKERRLHLPG